MNATNINKLRRRPNLLTRMRRTLSSAALFVANHKQTWLLARIETSIDFFLFGQQFWCGQLKMAQLACIVRAQAKRRPLCSTTVYCIRYVCILLGSGDIRKNVKVLIFGNFLFCKKRSIKILPLNCLKN